MLRSFPCLAASQDKQTSAQQLRGAGNQGAVWLGGYFRSLRSTAAVQVCHFPFPPPPLAVAGCPQPWARGASVDGCKNRRGKSWRFLLKTCSSSFPRCFQRAQRAECWMQAAGKLLFEGRGCRRCRRPLPVPAEVPSVPVAGWPCQQSSTKSPPCALPSQLTPQPQLC